MKIAALANHVVIIDVQILVQKVLVDQIHNVQFQIIEPVAHVLWDWYQVQLLKLDAHVLRLVIVSKIDNVLKVLLASMEHVDQFALVMRHV